MYQNIEDDFQFQFGFIPSFQAVRIHLNLLINSFSLITCNLKKTCKKSKLKKKSRLIIVMILALVTVCCARLEN